MNLIATSIRISLLTAWLALGLSVPAGAAPINIETANLLLSVEPTNCHWSAAVKGTPMQLNEVHFLPGDDASGWTVTSSVNQQRHEPIWVVRHGDACTGRNPDNSILFIKSPPARPETTSWSAWAALTTPVRRLISATWIILCRAMRGWAAPPTDGSPWEPSRATAIITTFGR